MGLPPALLVLLACLSRQALADDILVGGINGWSLGITYTTIKAVVGDVLVFNFNPAFHSVWQLPDSNCDFGAPGVVRKDVGTSPTKVKLTSVGSFYFGCGTPGHCAGGMSLTVEVAATAGGDVTWVASVGNDCNQTCFNLGMRPVTVQKTKLLCSHSKEYTLAAPPGAVTSLTRYGNVLGSGASYGCYVAAATNWNQLIISSDDCPKANVYKCGCGDSSKAARPIWVLPQECDELVESKNGPCRATRTLPNGLKKKFIGSHLSDPAPGGSCFYNTKTTSTAQTCASRQQKYNELAFEVLCAKPKVFIG